MAISRRALLKIAAQSGLASVTAPLWSNLVSSEAFAQTSSSYKAIIVVSLPGGNDGNNTLIPLDTNVYNQYQSLRPSIAVWRGDAQPLNFPGPDGKPYGLHPALHNVASLYNQKRAAVIANIGPLKQPATKSQLLANSSLLPAFLLSHTNGISQWQSSSTVAFPPTGWGGRMADLLVSKSGSLPPVLDAGYSSLFTVGNSVQAIAVQANSGALVALPAGMDNAILSIAQADSSSANLVVAQAAKLRAAATQQQLLITQAQAMGANLATQFPNSDFGNALKAIAQCMAGRSVIGASRQIFYCNQGGYDTHDNQTSIHYGLLTELDGGLGAMIAAIDELGLSNQVLICTMSDFNRSMQANDTGGTDHAWGNHQLILGGINGGQIFGQYPTLDLGGSSDLNQQGLWIPTLSVTQMAAGIGAWMGLTSSQLATIFPDLANFPTGALSFA